MKSNPPKYFCFNRSNVKAFVLGCDPTNKTNSGNRVNLEFAFGIGKDARYFRPILDNLNLIGLHLEDLYVQNMIVEYQDLETSKNKQWEKDSIYSIKERIKEFRKIDSYNKIPVFLTSQELYNVLLNDGEARFSPDKLYSLTASIPILPNQNKLGWTLFPLFRNRKYNLKYWPEYKNEIIQYLKTNS